MVPEQQRQGGHLRHLAKSWDYRDSVSYLENHFIITVAIVFFSCMIHSWILFLGTVSVLLEKQGKEGCGRSFRRTTSLFDTPSSRSLPVTQAESSGDSWADESGFRQRSTPGNCTHTTRIQSHGDRWENSQIRNRRAATEVDEYIF